MTSRKNKRPGSAVWEYFDVPHDQDEIAACNLCGDILKRGIPGKKVSYSTKSLWGHLKSKHSNEFTSAEERQAVDKTQQEKKRKEEQARSQQYFLPNFELSSSSRDRTQITDLQTPTTSRVNEKSHGHHQTSLNSFLEKNKKFERNSPDQLKGEMLLVYWLCDSMSSYASVGNPHFQEFVGFLNKRFTVPAEKSIRQKLIPELNLKIQYLVKCTLDRNVDSVYSLTTDIWTSPSNDSFMSITAHWIDNEYHRRFVVLRCVPYNIAHTSENLAVSLKNICNEWGLKNIHAIFRDNAQNIVRGVIEADFKGVGCFCHILNLVVKHSILLRKGGEITALFTRLEHSDSEPY